MLLATGIVATRPESISKEWAVGSLIIILTFIWDSTIGPVCYSLIAEIPSSRLRIKTVVLARVAYKISSLATDPLNAATLSPSAWNWGGKASFLWAGTTMLCLIWCYFRLPEPKGLTYIELDILFNKNADTKKFQELQVRLDATSYFSLTRPETRVSVGQESR
jgi:MFS transporter, SP family, general alpha glucoside:H+ symporter